MDATLEIAVKRVQEELKKLTKLLPSFVLEHPEIYYQYGLPKEIERAKKLDQPLPALKWRAGVTVEDLRRAGISEEDLPE